MYVLEKIYEAYIAGDLNVKPQSPSTEEREYIEKFITKCELTEEQALVLNEFLCDTIDHCGKDMFFAGFKLAAKLMNELFANSNRKNGNK